MNGTRGRCTCAAGWADPVSTRNVRNQTESGRETEIQKEARTKEEGVEGEGQRGRGVCGASCALLVPSRVCLLFVVCCVPHQHLGCRHTVCDALVEKLSLNRGERKPLGVGDRMDGVLCLQRRHRDAVLRRHGCDDLRCMRSV